MGILKNLTELSERIGANTSDYADLLSEEVRNFACELWLNYPDKITNNDKLSGSFTRGFMNRMCRDKTLPTAPASPFIGGQCLTVYWWDITFRVSRAVPSRNLSVGDLIIGRSNNPISGKIDSTRAIPVNDIKPFIARATSNDVEGGNMTFNLNTVGIEYAITSSEPLEINVIPVDIIISESFIRADGLPDDCGNPDSSYPSSNPTPADYTTIINIISEDGDTISYPLTYTPINFNFPMYFDLGGLTVVIDLGGINFYFSLLSIDGIPIPLPDDIAPPLLPPGDDKNREIPIPKLPPPSSPIFEPLPRDETDPKEEEIGTELEFVRVTLTSKPINHKRQWGDGAPNVIYAGWFEFQSEGYNFPRQPIHFDNCLYRKPEGATGYAYTLYKGFVGYATVYIKKEELI